MKRLIIVALFIASGCTAPQAVDLSERPRFSNIQPRLKKLHIGMTPDQVVKILGLEGQDTPLAGSMSWATHEYSLQGETELVLHFETITRRDGKPGLSAIYVRVSKKMEAMLEDEADLFDLDLPLKGRESVLTGVLGKTPKAHSPHKLELDGRTGSFYLRGDILENVPEGIRIWVKGEIKSELYDSSTIEGISVWPTHWMIFMDVKEYKKIKKAFEKPREKN